MYVETVPNRNSRPAILLREGRREGARVRKRTLANLTDWPAEKVDSLRRVLKGQRLVSPEAAFTIERSVPHGHVELLLAMVRRSGLDRLIAPKRSLERDMVAAMVVERVMHPASEPAAVRLWHATTLAEELDLGDVGEDAPYRAMDWLLARRGRIERELARRHPHEGEPAFADTDRSCYGECDIGVCAHPFLCLLAGYLERHLRRAWSPLLFDDGTPAEARRADDGAPLHSLDTLIAELATRCRNTCRIPADPDAPPLSLLTEPTPIHRRAADLIETFPVPGTPKG